MLTDLQRVKLTHQFGIYDADGDGVLTRADIVRVADTLAEARGDATRSPEHQLLTALYLKMWEPIERLADLNLGKRVTVSEYLAFHDVVLNDRAQYEEMLSALTHAMFAVVDSDADGVVHLAEYEQFARAMGIQGTPASWFPRLDTDSDGELTKDDVRALTDEFYFSDDPRAPGNWFFGAF